MLFPSLRVPAARVAARQYSTAAPGKESVLSLYRNLLKTGNKFTDYNVRSYVNRRVKTDFRKHKDLTDSSKISEVFSFGQKQLEIAKRQSVISELYKGEASVMESYATGA
mmetsp:Transcript_16857/g.19125  ORF Transcript_16857/g.19125 Transcript_16857/m.19125 type:complete len:110 (-) Transcript_16857:1031-1360(-)